MCILFILKCGIAVLLCAAAWQSRPPRPSCKQRAVGDMQDVTETGNPWNRWAKIPPLNLWESFQVSFICFNVSWELHPGLQLGLILSFKGVIKRAKRLCWGTQRRWTCSERFLKLLVQGTYMSGALCMAHVVWIFLDRTVMTLSWR